MRRYLKSGMPLGVLIPAPAITTTRRHSLCRMRSATSRRVSCWLPPAAPLPLPKRALAAAATENGRVPGVLRGTQSAAGTAYGQ